MTQLKSFDRVAAIYDETRSVPPHVADAVTRALLAILRGAAATPRVLEVGIGTGRIAVPLSAAGVHVAGIDISPKMLGVLRRKDPRIDCLFAEASRPPFRDASFDAALFVHILHLVPDAEATVGAAVRLLRPGGVLIRVRDDHDEDGYHVRAGQVMWEVIEEITGSAGPPEPHALGASSFEQVATQSGLTLKEITVAQYDAPFNARRAMEHLRRRDFSSHWAIPEDRFDEIAAAVERRYESMWGDLDVEHPAVKTAGMTVARAP
jgi:SAM-dependent methyltransferase